MTYASFGKRARSAAPFSFFKAFAVALSLFLLNSCGGPPTPSLGDEAALSPPEAAHLAALKADLAASKNFYAELSLRDGELRLCHSGTFLRKYKLSGASVQHRRLLFFSSGKLDEWNNRIWRNGELSPPRVIERVRIIPGDESTRPTPGKPGILPPTMEEIISVPSSFNLEFPEGLTVRVELRGEIPGKKLELKKKNLLWNDFLCGLGLRKGPAVRLNLEMEGKEGAAFFRSLPENSPLLILP
ncbi:MAG TPA: hypothetical protein PK747_05820 [Acidobacteriota bacterium]|nr:hypothetical protein [Acidobacteriota bacterium]HNT18440.1 hypothetical protein [Acidobacteriota bacterium]HPA26719.1 hypothetical protein [Acidobacteriota bacterium]HQO20246.1 hypothetical protein [Acidobacteriota bacterium]HQQ46911.1 hypothetical protein [Acidobacteriota bacterium]